MTRYRSRYLAAFRVLVFLTALLFAYWVRAILPPFILAFVITYILEPPVGYLRRRGFSRQSAVILIFALAFLSLSVLLLEIIPSVISEMARFIEVLPGLVNSYRQSFDNLASRYNQAGLPRAVRAIVDEAVMSLEASALVFVRTGVDSIVNIAQGTVEYLLSPVIAYYLLRDFDVLRQRMKRNLPGGEGGKFARLVSQVDRALNAFIRGQSILAIIVSAIVTVVSLLLGLKFSLLLGLAAFVGEFIPYFGPMFAAVPAVLSALSESPGKAVTVLVLFILIQQVEGAILSPRILGESLGLHPIAVVFVLLAGGHLAGFWGLLFGVPLFVVLRILTSFVYLEYLKPE